MLKHQIEFSKAIEEIYMPISGQVSNPETYVDEGNAAGIRACEQYEAIMRELQVTLEPELETINTRVIRPADELLEVIKVIHKSSLKRSHKQLDYDRHKAALKKLQEKKEKTLKDEKALYKAENDVELATQDFNHYNDLLKDELPKLFELEKEFIKPLFQSFYYMQLNLFYTLYEKIQNMDIGYFDLSLDIEAAFAKKRGNIQERAESLGITHYKTAGGVRRPGQNRLESSQSTTEQKLLGTGRYPNTDGPENVPPPYSPVNSSSAYIATNSAPVVLGNAASVNNNLSAVAKTKGAPPPAPKPKPVRLSAPVMETVTALYDYGAQAEGDLSFNAGDVIEIIQRTGNENEWWMGRVHGREGQFPGKIYCTIILQFITLAHLFLLRQLCSAERLI